MPLPTKHIHYIEPYPVFAVHQIRGRYHHSIIHTSRDQGVDYLEYSAINVGWQAAWSANSVINTGCSRKYVCMFVMHK